MCRYRLSSIGVSYTYAYTHKCECSYIHST
uniref:Uncharacterized protein n=1 Tax=Arundo donax TaxID=35708 RepID=A0A0A8ZZI6_ARUDO